MCKYGTFFDFFDKNKINCWGPKHLFIARFHCTSFPLFTTKVTKHFHLKDTCLFVLVTERDYPELTHSWDIWHGAKNLAKKLTKVSCSQLARKLS